MPVGQTFAPENVTPAARFVWDKLSPERIQTIITRHSAYLRGRAGGARASFKLVNLSGVNFANLDLTGADFSGARLEGCRLAGATLAQANLFACDLRDADLRGASLRNAQLEGASLVEADLRFAWLAKNQRGGELLLINERHYHALASEMGRATVRGADLTRARMSDAFIVQTDLTDAILRDARIDRANGYLLLGRPSHLGLALRLV